MRQHSQRLLPTSMTTQAGNHRFGPYELRSRGRELYKLGVKVKLRPQAFQVLKALVERSGDILTREELHELLWPKETFVDFEHGLNAAISELRGVLNDTAADPRYIETLPKVGYRIKVPIELLETLEPAVAANENAAGIPLLTPGVNLGPTGAGPGSPSQSPEREDRATHAAPSLWTRPWLVAATVGLLSLLAVAYFTFRGHNREVGQTKINSLAVLPLKSLSADNSQEYLADGMTEALISRLSTIHNLRVISRTSVMRFKNPQMSVPDIAQTLHVDAIVEGSVMREGEHIRVTAQLIRGATDEHFWSQTYDRQLGDALALQSDLAQSIAEKVQVTVTGEEHARLTATRAVAPEVYESYLKGRFVADKSNSKADIDESIVYFEEALKKDPTFAPAYVGLAKAYDNLGTVFIGVPPAESRPKVINAARKALELDPNLPEAHVLLADTEQRQWHWAEAERDYRRAIELNPNDPVGHEGLAFWLLCQGRTEEAVVSARRGRELDPLSISGDAVAGILFQSHRYAEAIQESRSALAVQPNNAGALFTLGFALIANDQARDAIPALEQAASISNRSPAVIGVLIRAYAHANRRSEALKLLAELQERRKEGYVPAGAFVNAYLGLDENEQAFVWLEQAYKEQSNILQFIKVHPYFDPLRADPRFVDLVRRVGLT
jgi:TolB-like protein/DNA-binding winged helix-turn-helix (wHTH) protein/Flp pilus assembly protein TadD